MDCYVVKDDVHKGIASDRTDMNIYRVRGAIGLEYPGSYNRIIVRFIERYVDSDDILFGAIDQHECIEPELDTIEGVIRLGDYLQKPINSVFIPWPYNR